MKKIAIIHPELGLGGPDTVAVWVLEALREQYDIELILCREANFKKIDDIYGTSLHTNNLKVKIVKIPNLIKNSAKGRLLKQHMLMRFCKMNASKYDLLFSTYNEMDFGIKGIQYIHFPSMNITQNARYNLMIDKWYYKDSLLRRTYLWLGKIISGYQERNILRNITLVNSNWTGGIVKKIYGINSITLHPPVLDDLKYKSWDLRKNGFVFIGIISPDKKITNAISILKKVRERGHDISFHIIGRIRGEGSNHQREFFELLEQNKDWVFYEGALSRSKMLDIISENKYGIHAKQEHFGISIAELIKGGCITFVPDEGGQLEIIGDTKDYLAFADENGAVKKIISVLNDDNLQMELRKKLEANIDKFSLREFKYKLLAIVETLLNGDIQRINK